MNELAQGNEYIIDSNLGQYGFYYDNTDGKYKYTLNYWTDPRFGQYLMYYDMISSGGIRYTFKFNVDPNFGAYTFIYDSMEKVYIEEEILLKSSNNKIAITDIGVNAIRTESARTNISINSFNTLLNSFDKNIDIKTSRDTQIEANSLNETRDITIDDFITILFYESIATKNISIIDDKFALESNKTHNIDVSTNKVGVDSELKSNLKIDSSEEVTVFENRQLDTSISSTFSVSTVDIISKIHSDDILMDTIKRKIEMQQDKRLYGEVRGIEIEKSKRLFSKIKDIQIQEIIELNAYDKGLNINTLYHKLNSINKTVAIDYAEGNTMLKELDKNIHIDNHEINALDVNKSIHIDEGEIQSSKRHKDSYVDGNEVLTSKVAGHNDIDGNEVLTNNTAKQNSIEESYLLANTKAKDSSLQDNSMSLDKYKSNIKLEEEILLGKSKVIEIEKEIEERLDLHKRFWFLESLGEMDYKILPNIDYKYPPNIDIFHSNIDNDTYVYKYTDKFKVLGNYRVRLYREDLTIMGQHDIIYIGNYNTSVAGIEIKSTVSEIDEDGYNYKVEFEIHTSIKADYMVINQPAGFIGNEFVFVTTEEFMANNHPIPFGEDLGLREIPVSISIMVDFVNILLLLWSKRLLAFSGMTGTQAVKGMNELVYEWLTLDTSLNTESIEDYFRCYRWLRWESEKVYNKAKLDPNLKGNRWIEEVIFEMIDYLEMHHFNKMPEWDTVIKMDEHRNIFTDPQYDIPIVLDKFKGIRKRVMEKNKRYN